MTRPCLIFIHVPRTAGTTLRGVLLWKYRRYRARIIKLYSPGSSGGEAVKKLLRIPVETRARAKVVMGHIPYGLHEHLMQECTYITVLREPVGRVLSLYRWAIARPGTRDYERLSRDGGGLVGLEEYVSTDIDKWDVENGQTRQISGTQSEDVKPSDLGTAKRNLETFLLAGLTERFDESFLLLCKALGWCPYYVTRNVSPDRTDRIAVSESALEVIKERNQLDLELYDFASRSLDGAVEARGRSFQRELAVFKTLNRVPNAFGQRAEGLIRAYARSPLVRGLWSMRRK